MSLHSTPPLSPGESVLVDLAQWLARIMQYSAQHQTCAQLGEKTLSTLQRALDVAAPVTYGILKDGVLLHGDVLATAPAAKQRLAPHLHQRGAMHLRFVTGVTLNELTAFMDVLTLSAQTIFDRGGLTRALAQRGVHGIQVDEIEHDITTEERAIQTRRQNLRTFFTGAVKNLLARRGLGLDIGRQLLELLDHPEMAVALLEEDPLGVCDAVAAACLMVRQEEAKTGAELFDRLRRILVALSPLAHDRVLLGFPSLVGEFRDALGWAIRRLDENDLARMTFPSLRRRATELGPVFHALAAAVPHDGDRHAALRRAALGFYDLPIDDAAADEVLAAVARPAPEFDSYRRERDCLAPLAVGALERRSLLVRRHGSNAPPADARALAVDARRLTAEVVKMSARTRRFDRLCTRLPAATAALAKASSTQAILGIVQGLQSVSRVEWREMAAGTLEQIASPSLVSKLLDDLDETTTSEDAGLDDLVAVVRSLVALHPEAVLDRLETCESRKMRRLLLDALPHAGTTLLPFIRAKLQSQNWFVVRNAVMLLPRVGGNAADVLRVYHHPNEKVRLEIARALRSLPIDANVTAIAATYLGDSSAEVRIQARGLVRGEQMNQAGIQALERVADDETQPEESRRIATEALGQSADDAAANALFRLLQPRGLIDLGPIRDLAALALRRSPAPQAPTLFEEGLRSSVRRVRKACERAAEIA